MSQESERLSRTTSIRSCPTCGQCVPGSGLLVDVTNRTLVLGEHAARLTPRQIDVVRVLMQRAPHAASIEQIIIAVWGDDEPEDADGVIRVYVHQLRALLKPLGMTIRNICKVGYVLEAAPETLAAAKRATTRRRAA